MKAIFTTLLLAASTTLTAAQRQWENIDYVGDNIEGHKLDIILPESSKGPFKPIVLIYGSAWFANNAKGAAIQSVGKPLLDAGFAVVSINHRASGEAKFPAQINDVKAAIRYVRGNAGKYNLDTSFIGITGYSSGGHLSSLAGTTNGVKTWTVGKETVDIEGNLGNFTQFSSSVDAVVDWFGPIDMSRMENCTTTKGADSPEAVLLGCAPADNLDKVALLSPMTYIDSNDPSFLVIHGNTDPVVPYCQSEYFAKALKDKGLLEDFITVEGGGHGPVTFNDDTFRRMTGFFKSKAGGTGTASSAPELDFVVELRVKVDKAFNVGSTAKGYRTVVPIVGGRFEGPDLHGEVLPGGADYQLHGQGRSQLEAIYCLRTDDGSNIHIRNLGVISRGGKYFYTTPQFEADNNSRYAWLNDYTYVCRPGGFVGDSIVLNVWRVRDAFDFQASIEAIRPIPDHIFQPADKQGRIELFNYTVMRDGKKMKKHARVYVPYGYNKKDKSTKYNVVYLMHGGGDNSTSFLTPPQDWLPLKQVLDHLIAEGQMAPVLVVTPTFYDDDENIGANRMQDAIKMTRDFHIELQHDLIPAVEKAYNTHLEGTDSLAITKSRDHRAFGGFSMGALCTWFQLAYGVNAVRHFLPLSGDLWVYDEKGQKQSAAVAARWMDKQLAATPFANSFTVRGYTGTSDIAGNPQKQLVEALNAETALFRYKKPDANLFFAMKQGGQHYYGDINQYLYYALPLLWKK